MQHADWDDLKLFFHVASAGGLSGAAEATGLSAPTIGRRMLALERRMGRALFIRSQQGYRLAPDGEALLNRVRAMHDAAEGISLWHQQAFATPLVSIGSDAWLSGFIADHAAEIRKPGDGFRLCCKTVHDSETFTFRATDVGIVSNRPSSGNLAVRASVEVRYAAYHALTDADPDNLPWTSIGTESAATAADGWTFENHEADITTWTNAPALLLRLLLSGNGRGVLPCFVGDALPDLRRTGPVIDALSHPLFIVANDDDRHRPEMRLVLDRLAAFLKQQERRFKG
ncbi:LysR family transcriptional regulator [Rhizobium sp. FY34]|uniref:LysR family transcriptional regulator n=1 Tax=Rhizobium sp. FY34 TaxID=2562309 RepID=UPI0010BFCB84|nr:LysR family transcriptional regulator [Rhizobium sp. FY34]